MPAGLLPCTPAHRSLWFIDADSGAYRTRFALLFDNESLRAGHAEKQARWQDLLAPLIEPRLSDSKHRALEARAIAAAGITCLQAANEKWVRLRGNADIAELYDTAVRAVRRSD